MNESKPARNLSVLSFVVILYVLGGANFRTDGSLFGGSVTFTRVWVLEYAGLVLLAFYAYRFLIVTNILVNIIRLKNDYLRSSAKFFAYISGLGKEEMDRRLKSTQTINGKVFKEGSDPYPVRAHWSPDNPGLMKCNIFNRQTRISALDDRGSTLATFDIQLPWLHCFPFEIHAELKAIFLNEDFWNDIFPLILCLIAFLLVAAHKFNLV